MRFVPSCPKILLNLKLSLKELIFNVLVKNLPVLYLHIERFKNCVFNFKVNNKDKRIAFLESQLSELGHRLTLKDAECECHLWKLEMLMQQNRVTVLLFNAF